MRRGAAKAGSRASGARARAALGAAREADPQQREPSEWWARLAYALFAGVGLLYAYLGLRPGGQGPLYAWRYGRDLGFLLALAVLCWALIGSSIRRPFFQRRRLRPLVCLALVLGVTPFQFPYPSSHEGRPSRVTFRLPCEGEWRVFWGGEDKETNRLASFFAEQRWALALVREENGRRVREGASPTGPWEPEDYLAYGATVLAPAAGEVVWSRDELADAEMTAYDPQVPALGNLIVLRVADGQYLFLAHLQQGSLLVPDGSRVEAGQALARVGSSGFSRLVGEPHLLSFLQDAAEEGVGEPIPWSFQQFFAGDRFVQRSLPYGGVGPDGRLVGQRVRHAAAR